MTVFLPIMHCLPILMLAKSPRNTHSDCTIVYIGKGRGCILATPISVGIPEIIMHGRGLGIYL